MCQVAPFWTVLMYRIAGTEKDYNLCCKAVTTGNMCMNIYGSTVISLSYNSWIFFLYTQG